MSGAESRTRASSSAYLSPGSFLSVDIAGRLDPRPFGLGSVAMELAFRLAASTVKLLDRLSIEEIRQLRLGGKRQTGKGRRASHLWVQAQILRRLHDFRIRGIDQLLSESLQDASKHNLCRRYPYFGAHVSP